MFQKLLIANRGEIACRVMRTARSLGIRTVAVYSDADVDALHVAMADEAVHIGAAPARESYLRAGAIIKAARRTGAEAIHPGYGFLSENVEFAAMCRENRIVFVGPPVGALQAMASKSTAKTLMGDAGVPIVPGYHGEIQTPEVIRARAKKIGYPVLLKAVAAGGGKGMRVVERPEDFDSALEAAQREARSSVGDDEMLVEKYLDRPRHIEIQIFCDRNDNAVHLYERDCSVQRRHQKILEEAPAPAISTELRNAMGGMAVRAAQAIRYEGAGTVEFLLDQDGSYYFMEMNTRLQVEHPVTEMITGLDLVEWQLRVAAGESLPLRQSAIPMRGHAIEARIYAEDPDNDFLPATGTLTFVDPPATTDHVRIDSGVRPGDEVSVHYDPMIAKLIVWEENRERALSRMLRALSEYRIGGVKTNIEFLYNLVASTPYRAAELDTSFIQRHHEHLFPSSGDANLATTLQLASLYLLLRREHNARTLSSPGDRYSPWNDPGAWRLNEPSVDTGGIVLNGRLYDVPAEQLGAPGERRYRITACGQTVTASGSLEGHRLTAVIDGYRSTVSVVEHESAFTLFSQDGAIQFSLPAPDFGDAGAGSHSGSVSAPMNGIVVAVRVAVGDSVTQGQQLVVMEAMKMEHALAAPYDGVVAEVHCAEGDLVDGGAELLAIAVGAASAAN